MAKQFQVTLLSNACKSIFPCNVPNRFTTKLYSTIELHGEWEVALVGILYPFTAQNIQRIIRLGMLMIARDIQETQEYELQNEMTEEVLDYKAQLKSLKYTHAYREISIEPGYFKNIQAFFHQLNRKTEEAYMTIEDEEPFHFYYDPVEDLITLQRGARSPILFTNSDYLPGIMGAVLDPEMSNVVNTKALREDWFATIHPRLDPLCAMFVYTDIIKYQMVGDIQAPLLTVIPIKGTFGEQVYCRITEPVFVPLARNNIQTIDIRLCTETGQPYPIKSKGIVVAILSFRQKPYK